MSYTIFIKRLWQSENSTISEFSISGTEISGYFLERPGPDTTEENLRKRIPDGSYSLKWHASGRMRKFSPLPNLFNASVPSSRAILIHPGNVPDDTDGCLLPGKSKGDDRIGQSLGLYEEIKQLMVDKGIENFNVLITSCYVDCKK